MASVLGGIGVRFARWRSRLVSGLFPALLLFPVATVSDPGRSYQTAGNGGLLPPTGLVVLEETPDDAGLRGVLTGRGVRADSVLSGVGSSEQSGLLPLREGMAGAHRGGAGLRALLTGDDTVVAPAASPAARAPVLPAAGGSSGGGLLGASEPTEAGGVGESGRVAGTDAVVEDAATALNRGLLGLSGYSSGGRSEGVSGRVDGPDAEAVLSRRDRDALEPGELRHSLKERAVAAVNARLTRALDSRLQGMLLALGGEQSGLRLDSSLRWDVREGVQGGLDVFVPFFGDADSTWFLQPGFLLWPGLDGERRHDLNIGGGYRRRVGDGVAGGGVFYDHNVDSTLQRLGLSLDFRSGRGYGALNVYYSLTDWEDSGEAPGQREEHALGGLDLQLRYALTDALEVHGSLGMWEHYEEGSGEHKGLRPGGSFGVDYELLPGLSFGGSYEIADALGKDRYELGLRFVWPAQSRLRAEGGVADLYSVVKREKRILYARRDTGETDCGVELRAQVRGSPAGALSVGTQVEFSGRLVDAEGMSSSGLRCVGLGREFLVSNPVEVRFRDRDGDGGYEGAELQGEPFVWRVPAPGSAGSEGFEYDVGSGSYTLRFRDPSGVMPESRIRFVGGDVAGDNTYVVVVSAGVSVVPQSLTVDEGGSGVYTVQLNSRPEAEVSITVLGATGDVTVSGSPLSFDASNWRTQQTVTVTAGGDADAEDDRVELSHRASSGDSDYAGVEVAGVTVTVTDTTPGAAASLSAVAGDKQVTLTWGLPVSGGARASWQYRQKAGSNAYGAWTAVPSSNAGTTSYTVSGLTNDTEYRFQVRAVGSVGTANYGVASAEASATPRSAAVAGVTVNPQALTVDEGDSSGGTYTVVLATQPSAAVTVTPSSDNADVEFTPATLSFSTSSGSGGWDMAQTVTVTADVDADADNDSATLTHGITGGDYASVDVPDVRVTVTDTTPGAVSSLSAVAGDAQVTLTWGLPVSGGTRASWQYRQKEGSNAYGAWTPVPGSNAGTISHTVSGLTNDSAYRFQVRAVGSVGTANYGVASAEASATPRSVAVAGVTVNPQALTVDEGDSNGGTYTVVLATQPSAVVTVTPSSNNADVKFTPATLTFGTGTGGGGWATAQSVTVTADADADADNDSATLTHSITGGDYATVNVPDVNVTVTDTTPELTLETAPSAVAEGTAISVTVTSDKNVSGTLSVSLTLADRGSSGFTADDITGALTQTFTTGNFNGGKTAAVTIATADDAIVEGAETYRITLGSGTGYALGSSVAVDGTLNDNDSAQVTLGSGTIAVTEGQTLTVPVTMSAAADTVVNGRVTLSSGTPTDDFAAAMVNFSIAMGQMSGNAIFLPKTANNGDGNYNAPRSYTATVTLTTPPMGVTVGSDNTDPVTVTDNTPAPRPGVRLSATTLTVSEGNSDGGSYTVVLASAPDADVTVTVGGTLGDVTVSGSPLTFTSGSGGNWNMAQTVTVTAAVDSDTDDDSVTLTHSASGATGYGGGLSIDSVAVTVTDTTPGAAASLSAVAGDKQVMLTWGLPVSGGSRASWQYRQKAGSNAYGAWTPVPSSNAGTTSYTVSGLTNDTEYRFQVRAVGSVGTANYGVASAEASATPRAAAVAGVTVNPQALTVDEGDSAGGTYTVVLDTQPSAAVTVTPSSNNADVKFTPSTLSFATGTGGGGWDTAQTVTVTADVDADADNDSATLTHGITGGDYASVDVPDVSVMVTDTTPELTLETAPSAVAEGTAISVTVTSDKNVSGTLSVSLTLSDRGSSGFTADDITGALTRTFTTASFNNGKTAAVTIATVDDAIVEGAETYTITLGSGTGYALGDDVAVDGTLNDNDSAQVTLASGTIAVTEGQTLTVPVTMSAAADAVVNGRVTLSGGTPTDDFAAAMVNFSIAASQTSGNASFAAQAPGTGDSTYNAPRSYTATVTLTSPPAGVTVGSDNTDPVTVTDNTAAPSAGVRLSATTLTVDEGDGDGGSYTVVLATQPDADVTVTVSSAALGDVTVSGSPLTFTSGTGGNWNMAQTVTVTAAVDSDTDDDSVTLTHSVSGATGYGGSLSIDSVAVTVTDTTPGAAASLSAVAGDKQVMLTWGLPVSGGTRASWQYRATTETSGWSGASWTPVPSSNAGTTSYTVSGLTNNSAYRFQVRAVGSVGTDNFGVASAEASATPRAAPVAGVTVNPQALTVNEGDSNGGSYTVVLATQPSAAVTVTPSSNNADVKFTPSTLSFATGTGGGGWDTAQTVTVTADVDADADDDSATLTHGITGGDYATVNVPDVNVTVTDTTPGQPTGLTATAGDTQVELSWTAPVSGGNIGSWQYRATTETSGWVGASWMAIAGSDSTTTRHTVESLTNNSAYRFQVRAVGSVGTDNFGAAAAEARATPVAALPELTLSGTADGTEGGSLSLSLSSDIDVGGTLAVSFSVQGSTSATDRDAAAADFNGGTLSGVTTASFNNGKTAMVSLRLTDDASVEGDEGFRISLVAGTGYTVASGSAVLSGTLTDNDGIRLTAETGKGATEGGTLSVSLSAVATSDGGTTYSTDTDFGGTLSGLSWSYSGGVAVAADFSTVPSSASFSDGTASVDFMVADDSDSEESYSLQLSAVTGHTVVGSNAVSGKLGAMLTFAFGSATATVTEGDAVSLAVNVSPTPVEDITVFITTTDGTAKSPADYISGGYSLSFGAGDSSSNLFIQSEEDTLVEGDEAFTAMLTGSNRPAIARIGDPGTVTVTIEDDDTAAAGVRLSATTLTVDEGDSAGGTYTVVLATQPDADVTVTVGGTLGDVTVSGSPLTFTSGTGGNWATVQTVTVTAAVDSDTDDDSVTLTHSASGATGYGGSLSIDSVAVTVTDTTPGAAASLSAVAGNAQVTLTWGLPVSGGTRASWQYRQKAGSNAYGAWTPVPGSNAGTTSHTVSSLTNDTEYRFQVRAVGSVGTANVGAASAEASATPRAVAVAGVTVNPQSLTVDEGDNTGGTYTVVLATEPSGPVTVTVGGTLGDVTVSGSPLTFTSGTGGNWNTAQTVTVKAGLDADASDDSVTLMHTASSSDNDYQGVTINSVEVTVRDTTPVLQLLTDPATVNEGSAIQLRVTANRAVAGSLALNLRIADRSVWQNTRPEAMPSGTDASDFPGGLTQNGVTAAFNGGTTATVSIATDSDSVDEGDDYYRITLVAGSGYTVGTDANADGVLDEPITITGFIFRAAGARSVESSIIGVGRKDAPYFEWSRIRGIVSNYSGGRGRAGLPALAAGDDGGYLVFYPSSQTVSDSQVPSTIAQCRSFNDATRDRLCVHGPSRNFYQYGASGGAIDIAGDATLPTNGFATLGLGGSGYSIPTRYVDLTAASYTMRFRRYTGTLSAAVTASRMGTMVTLPALTLETAPSTVTEGAAISVTVTSDSNVTGTLSVSLTLADRGSSGFTADDITGALTQTFTTGNFNGGTTAAVTIPTVNDVIVEGAETYRITLGTGTGYTLGSDLAVDGTLNDNDSAEVTLASGTITVTEGQTLTVPVTMSAAADAVVNGRVTLSDGTPTADFAAAMVNFNIAAGDTGGNAVFLPKTANNGDGEHNASRSYTATVTLTSPPAGVTVGTDNTDPVTVTDNTPAPVPGVRLSATTLTVDEGDSAGGTYTVVLATQPDADVTVTVGGTLGDVTVSGSPLTFTSGSGGNWDMAQTVTVTAAVDSDTVNDSVTLTHSVSGGATGYGGGLSIDSVAVTVTDTTPGQPTGLTATAGDAQVELSWTAPGSGGSIGSWQYRATTRGSGWAGASWTPVPSSNAGTTRYTVESLTNESRYRFQVRAVGSVGTGNVGAASAEASATPVAATPPGVRLSETTLTVDEGDATGDNYTVVLATQPDADVTVTVSGFGGTDVRATPATLTFGTGTGPGGWDTAQTVTVTAVEDSDTDNDSVTLTHAASGATGYGGGLSIANVAVTVTDTTPKLTLETNPSAVAEGTAISVTVTSDKAVSGTLAVSLTLADRSSSGFTAADIMGALTQTFTTASFGGGMTAIVTIATVNDAIVEGAETYRITLGSGTGYALGDDVTVDGTLNDNDSAEVTLASGTIAVTEGQTLTVPVTMSAAADTVVNGRVTLTGVGGSTPTADFALAMVDFSISAGDTSASAVFLAKTADIGDGDYNAARNYTATVTLRSPPMGVTVGSENTDTVTVTDNTSPPSAGVTLNRSSLTVTEEDTTGVSYTVVLNTAPTGDVTVTVAGFTGTDVTATPATLTFGTGTGPGGWSTAQSVKVTAGDDSDADNDSVTLTHTASSSDNNYEGVSINPVMVTVTDNDTAGVRLSETTLTVTEEDTTGDSYTVVLATRPDADVTVTVAGFTGTDVTATPATLTFGTGTGGGGWATAQTVKVTAGDDANASNESVTLTHAASGATGYGVGLDIADVEVSVTDNDTAGVTLSPRSLTVDEGSMGNYTVVLDTQPSAVVTVTPSSNNADVTFSPATLRFGTGTGGGGWDTEQSVTVTARVDADADNDSATLTHVITGGDYARVNVPDVSVTVTDTTPAVTLETAPSAVSEGTAISVTVTSDKNVSGTLSVSLTLADRGSSGFTADDIMGALTQTFTTASFSGGTTAAVTIPTVNDAIVEGTERYRITLGSGTGYVLGSSVRVNGTLNDNDSAEVTLASTTITVTEGQTLTVPVTMSAAADTVVNGRVTLSDGTPTADFAAAMVNFSIAAGDTGGNAVFLPKTANNGDGNYNAPRSYTATVTLRSPPMGVTVGSDATDTVMVTDNTAAPRAGVTVSPQALTVDEGSMGSYTVVLDTQPSAVVTVTPSSNNADVTFSPATLTFGTGTGGRGWATEQSVTVTARSDADADNDSATLTHGITGGDYATVNVPDVSVTVTDTTPELTLATAPSAVAEGTAIRVTVTSDKDVTGTLSVRLTLSDRGSSGFTADDIRGALTQMFTTASFGSGKTAAVTIPTVNDAIVEGAETYTITLVSGTGYALGDDVAVDGTLNDNDSAEVTLASGTITVTEGQSLTVPVTMSAAADTVVNGRVTLSDGTPTADFAAAMVNFSIAAGDTGGNAVFMPKTANNGDSMYNAPRSYTATVTLTSPPMGVTVGSDNTDTVTVTDNTAAPRAGVRLSETTLTVDEGDATGDSYTVVLATQPDADVTVTVSGFGSTDVRATPATLTFGTGTGGGGWATAQTVTVTAVVDSDTADEAAVTLMHAASGATGYGGGLSIADVTVTVTDTTPGRPTGLTATAGDTQVELSWTAPGSGGSIASWQYRATTQTSRWAGASWMAITGSDSTTTSYTVESLTNGSPYRFQVRAVGSVGTGNVGAASAEASATPVAATSPGVTLSETTLTVDEGDATGDSYTVVLATQPDADVTVTVSGFGSTDVEVSPSELTFASAAWNTAQTVTVTAVVDSDTADEAAVTLMHAASGATGYGGGLSIADVTVTVTDTTPGRPTGLTATAGDTQVELSWTAPGSGGSIASWQYRQKEGGNAYGAWMAIAGSNAGTTGHTVESLTNGSPYRFRVRAVGSVGTDNFGAAAAEASATPMAVAVSPGVTLSETSLTVLEGATATYTVVLNTAPSAAVTVTPSSDNADVTFSPATLSFGTDSGAGGWDTAQTVTVTGEQDVDTNDDSATLTHGISGGNYASLTVPSVAVTVTEAVTVTVADATVDEGDTVRLRVTVTGRLSTDTTVVAGRLTLGAGGDSATSGADYRAGPLSYRIPEGQTGTTVELVTVDDALLEGRETLSVQATVTSPATGYTGGPAATVRIEDDDRAILSFASTDVSGSEAAGNATLEVQITRASGFTDRVDFELRPRAVTGDDAAEEGADFSTVPVAGHFPASSSTAVSLEIPVTDDAVEEARERFSVSLSTGVAGVGVGSPASVRITDNDRTWGLRLPPTYYATEGDTELTPVDQYETGSVPSNRAPIGFTFSVTPGTAVAADYTVGGGGRGSLRLTLQEGRFTIPVTIVDDMAEEGVETFTVTLTGPSAHLVEGRTSMVVQIAASDAMVPSGEQDFQSPENPRDSRYSLSRVGAEEVTEGGSVNYDFRYHYSHREVGPDDTSPTLSLEQIKARLDAKSIGYVEVRDGSNTLTAYKITNPNLPARDVTFYIQPYQLGFGEAADVSGLTSAGRTVSALGGGAYRLRFPKTTNSMAVVGDDETTLTLRLVVATADDDVFDPGRYFGAKFLGEQFLLRYAVAGAGASTFDDSLLNNPTDTAGLMASDQRIFKILNNDAPPNLSVSVSGTLGEGSDSMLTLTGTLSRESAYAVTVPWTTIPGTAVAGEDYTVASGSLTVPAGETSVSRRMVELGVIDDDVAEGTERLYVGLAPRPNTPTARRYFVVANPTRPARTAVDITDNDTADVSMPPSLSLSSAENWSVGTVQQIRVSLSKAVDYHLRVPWTYSGSSTHFGVLDVSPLEFAPGVTERVVRVRPQRAGFSNTEQDFTLTLSAVSPSNGASLPADPSITATLPAGSVSPGAGFGSIRVLNIQARTATAIVTLSSASYSGRQIAIRASSAQSGCGTSAGSATISGTFGVGALSALTPDCNYNLVASAGGGSTGLPAIQSAPYPFRTLSGTSGTLRAETVTVADGLARQRVYLPVVLSDYQISGTDTVEASVQVQHTPSLRELRLLTPLLRFRRGHRETAAVFELSGTRTLHSQQDIDVLVRVTGDTLPRSLLVAEATGQIRLLPSATLSARWVGAQPLTPSRLVIQEDNAMNPVSMLQVRLDQPLSTTLTVNWTTRDGSAVSSGGSPDYRAGSGRLVFMPGERQKTVSVTTLGDTQDEGRESLFVDLSSASGLQGLRNTGETVTAVLVLNNDDATIMASLGSTAVTGSEGGNATIPITLSAAAPRDLVLRWTATQESGDTADVAADLGSSSGDITIAAGESSASISIPLSVDDLDSELAERFTVTLSHVSGPVTIGSPSVARVTITNVAFPEPVLTLETLTPSNIDFRWTATIGPYIVFSYPKTNAPADSALRGTLRTGTPTGVVVHSTQTSTSISIGGIRPLNVKDRVYRMRDARGKLSSNTIEVPARVPLVDFTRTPDRLTYTLQSGNEADGPYYFFARTTQFPRGGTYGESQCDAASGNVLCTEFANGVGTGSITLGRAQRFLDYYLILGRGGGLFGERSGVTRSIDMQGILLKPPRPQVVSVENAGRLRRVTYRTHGAAAPYYLFLYPSSGVSPSLISDATLTAVGDTGCSNFSSSVTNGVCRKITSASADSNALADFVVAPGAVSTAFTATMRSASGDTGLGNRVAQQGITSGIVLRLRREGGPSVITEGQAMSLRVVVVVHSGGTDYPVTLGRALDVTVQPVPISLLPSSIALTRYVAGDRANGGKKTVTIPAGSDRSAVVTYTTLDDEVSQRPLGGQQLVITFDTSVRLRAGISYTAFQGRTVLVDVLDNDMQLEPVVNSVLAVAGSPRLRRVWYRTWSAAAPYYLFLYPSNTATNLVNDATLEAVDDDGCTNFGDDVTNGLCLKITSASANTATSYDFTVAASAQTLKYTATMRSVSGDNTGLGNRVDQP